MNVSSVLEPKKRNIVTNPIETHETRVPGLQITKNKKFFNRYL